jgi:hypothetical protein
MYRPVLSIQSHKDPQLLVGSGYEIIILNPDPKIIEGRVRNKRFRISNTGIEYL